jgi:O-acetyl-ADP-ribose deacetylase (regulator of RNase III)
MHMVAQQGIGPSGAPRLRYAALERCLDELARKAEALHASVHMPKIGSGHGGGDWHLIQELIKDIVVKRGINVTIYSLPPRRRFGAQQKAD